MSPSFDTTYLQIGSIHDFNINDYKHVNEFILGRSCSPRKDHPTAALTFRFFVPVEIHVFRRARHFDGGQESKITDGYTRSESNPSKRRQDERVAP